MEQLQQNGDAGIPQDGRVLGILDAIQFILESWNLEEIPQPNIQNNHEEVDEGIVADYEQNMDPLVPVNINLPPQAPSYEEAMDRVRAFRI